MIMFKTNIPYKEIQYIYNYNYSRVHIHLPLSLFYLITLLLEDNKADGQVYVDAKTYILLELELAEPLVPKRPASVIAEK